MATLTIKIDSEELSREVLAHMNYLPKEEMPDLISVVEPDEEPKTLTNKEVFAFLRSKGMTLESACKCDPEFGDFIASFTTAPEKRIHNDLEPAGTTSIGTDIADLDNSLNRFNVQNAFNAEAASEMKGIENAKNELRELISNLVNERARYDYLSSRAKNDQNLVVREAARHLLIDMPKPEPTPLNNIAYDSDPEIQNMALERAKKEREELEAEKDKIRKEAMGIENEHNRFSYIISYYHSELRRIRIAAMEIVFEFLANRNLDPLFISQLASQSETLMHKVYQYKESDFLIKFRKENGI